MIEPGQIMVIGFQGKKKVEVVSTLRVPCTLNSIAVRDAEGPFAGKYTYYMPVTSLFFDNSKNCPMCNGDGRDGSREACHYCWGKGELEVIGQPNCNPLIKI